MIIRSYMDVFGIIEIPFLHGECLSIYVFYMYNYISKVVSEWRILLDCEQY
jgi:hypothetical protein